MTVVRAINKEIGKAKKDPACKKAGGFMIVRRDNGFYDYVPLGLDVTSAVVVATYVYDFSRKKWVDSDSEFHPESIACNGADGKLE